MTILGEEVMNFGALFNGTSYVGRLFAFMYLMFYNSCNR